MDVATVPVAEIRPYARNNRKHPEQQVQRIAQSIREFGFNQPLVIDEENEVLVGHGRLLAAKVLGLESVPCLIVEGLSEAQKKAYRILDNKLQNDSEWDIESLQIELERLEELDFDLGAWGLDSLLPEAEETAEVVEDEAPDVRSEARIIKRGDIIELGRHRVMCGDSTSGEDVEGLLNGAPVDLLFTSPPYAQQREYGGGSQDWDTLMQGVFGAPVYARECQILVNLGLVHSDNEWCPYWESWLGWMREAGWRRFGWYVWDQGAGLPGDWNGRLGPSFEFVFHFNREAVRPQKWVDKLPESITPSRSTLRNKDGSVSRSGSPETGLQPTKIPDSVIRITRHMARGVECEHPAVFPVALPAFVMKCWGGLVYDPFGGSGATIVAAEQLGRESISMEIHPPYVELIIRRALTEFQRTGKALDLKVNGEPVDPAYFSD